MKILQLYLERGEADYQLPSETTANQPFSA